MLAWVRLRPWLGTPPLRSRRSLALASAFGVVLGIGFGFRNDLLINVPPFVVVLAVLTPGRLRDHLPLKAACLAAAALAFVVSAWPILGAYSGGSNSGHVMVLGWMS